MNKSPVNNVKIENHIKICYDKNGYFNVQNVYWREGLSCRLNP